MTALLSVVGNMIELVDGDRQLQQRNRQDREPRSASLQYCFHQTVDFFSQKNVPSRICATI